MIETGSRCFPFLFLFSLPNRVLAHSLALVESVEYDAVWPRPDSIRHACMGVCRVKRVCIDCKGGYD